MGASLGCVFTFHDSGDGAKGMSWGVGASPPKG